MEHAFGKSSIVKYNNKKWLSYFGLNKQCQINYHYTYTFKSTSKFMLEPRQKKLTRKINFCKIINDKWVALLLPKNKYSWDIELFHWYKNLIKIEKFFFTNFQIKALYLVEFALHDLFCMLQDCKKIKIFKCHMCVFL